MNMSLFKYKMTELDRQVLAATVANNNLITLRLRRMAGILEPRPAPRVPFYEGDDLLFDNVPV